MLVKAKWNVKDAAGWHKAGEVFETESDLGNAVIPMSAPRKPVIKEVEKEEPEPVKEAEPEKEPKKTTRRKTTAK